MTFTGASAQGQAAALQVHVLRIMGHSSPLCRVWQLLREAHDEHHAEERVDEKREEDEQRRDERVEETVENALLHSDDHADAPHAVFQVNLHRHSLLHSLLVLRGLRHRPSVRT